jgi:hypothetical protein
VQTFEHGRAYHPVVRRVTRKLALDASLIVPV